MKYNELILRNVFGKRVKLNTEGGVTKVDSLPEEGEAGKIYYNTRNGGYYVATDDGWVELTSNEMKVVSQHTTSRQGYYDIVPNILYDAGSMAFTYTATQGGGDVFNLHITLTGYKDGVAAFYVFRQTIPNNGTANITIVYPSGADRTVVIPDKAKEILESLEGGHTYEFNILHDVVMVADITETQESAG